MNLDVGFVQVVDIRENDGCSAVLHLSIELQDADWVSHTFDMDTNL